MDEEGIKMDWWIKRVKGSERTFFEYPACMAWLTKSAVMAGTKKKGRVGCQSDKVG